MDLSKVGPLSQSETTSVASKVKAVYQASLELAQYVNDTERAKLELPAGVLSQFTQARALLEQLEHVFNMEQYELDRYQWIWSDWSTSDLHYYLRKQYELEAHVNELAAFDRDILKALYLRLSYLSSGSRFFDAALSTSQQ